MWKVDLHAHTMYSHDSLTEPVKLIERAKQIGLNKIAITEHNRLDGALAAKALDPEFIIVGEEIMTQDGELLAYYLTEEVPSGLSLQETIKRLRMQGAVISVSHPLDRWRRPAALGLDKLLSTIDEIDAIEVLNARCIFPMDNQNAREIAQQHGKLVTAGSDAHTVQEIGQCHLVLPPFADDAKSFKGALLQANPHGKEGPIWPKFAIINVKWRRRFLPFLKRKFGFRLHL